MDLLEKLTSRNGGFAYPFLVHLYSENMDFYFVNYDRSIQHEGKIYYPSSYSYSPNPSEYGFDGGGTLEISSIEGSNQIINLLLSDNYIYCDVIGVIDDNGGITELKSFRHKYGRIDGNREKITFSYSKDNRPGMTFPSLIWSVSNNKGNA